MRVFCVLRTDLALGVDVAGHDADLALAGADDARAVRACTRQREMDHSQDERDVGLPSRRVALNYFFKPFRAA